MGTIDNTQCPFTVEIWDTTEGTSLPAGFTLTNPSPNLTAVTGDPCAININTYPSATMITSDHSLEFTTLDLLVTIHDTSLLTSTAKQSSLLSQITFEPLDCVPNLTLPTTLLASYDYKIGDPAL